MIASFLYMVAGPLAAWVESFILFLALRFTLGLAGSAVYETGYVLREYANYLLITMIYFYPEFAFCFYKH